MQVLRPNNSDHVTFDSLAMYQFVAFCSLSREMDPYPRLLYLQLALYSLHLYKDAKLMEAILSEALLAISRDPILYLP